MAKVGRNMAQEFQTGGIGPVQILEEHEDRAGGAELGEEAADLSEERGLVGDALQDAAGEGSRWGWQLGGGGIGRHEVEPGSVRRGVGQVVAVAGQHAAAARGRVLSQVPGQGGLADACLATEEDQPPMAGDTRGELFAQEDLLPCPADERRRRLSRGMPDVFGVCSPRPRRASNRRSHRRGVRHDMPLTMKRQDPGGVPHRRRAPLWTG